MVFVIGWVIFMVAIIIYSIVICVISVNKARKDAMADVYVDVNSRRVVENYDMVKFFKENKEKLKEAEVVIKEKEAAITEENKPDEAFFKIRVRYSSPTGRSTAAKNIFVMQSDIDRFKDDPSLLMGKAEYNKFLKEQQKTALNQKQHEFYERVNEVIDYANANKDSLIIKGNQKQLDDLIGQLFDRTVNSIKKVKSIDSEEWSIIADFISRIKNDVEGIVGANRRILEYYESSGFLKIKETCEALMCSQREFNEYIDEKVESISHLFGTRVIRNETINDDTYDYVRLYKKTVTPFTAEVSAAVFASAENNPLEYVVKYFYPNKHAYPEQIQNLYHLVEELETLKDAKQIIENYKAEYQQYIEDVPDFVMQNDESGFYSRLGFANVDESVLAVEYKFSYTSGGGMAQRSFTIPMTEETVAELIRVLESKLTTKAFMKEQRALMTKKLRESIKKRDNFTCCNCGNSIYVEPNLLLEIDHIIPVSKGGWTVEDNLQTLCWKCNRAKSDKIIEQ